MTIPPFEDRAPTDDCITDSDERHFVTYLRLLDADADGADWREAVEIIFDLNVNEDAIRAQIVHSSHLERAYWMTQHGYRHLLEKSRQQ